MILNYLHLHNFMSYADAALDLSGVTVACLTGLNGAGKSALLDAVTWALWEEARAGSDELIRLGEKEMWVDLIFAHEGRLYRVKRSRQRAAGKAGGRGVSKGHLELMVAQGSAGTAGEGNSFETMAWVSMTSASMKDTGRHIQDLLRMDFDTFINSAYLKQGRAEEFTTRPPGERKQVLSEILGLSYFDRLQEEAREQLRSTKSKIDFLNHALSGKEDTQLRLLSTSEELDAARLEFDEASVLLDQMEEKQRLLNEQLGHLQVVAADAALNLTRQQDLQGVTKRLVDQKNSLAVKIETLTLLIGAGPDASAQIDRFEVVRGQVEAFDERALRFQDLNERKVTLSGELSRERSRLELTVETAERSLAELEKRREGLDKEVSGEAKIRAAYSEYKEMLAVEAELNSKQEAYIQLSVRSGDLQNAIQESRIHLEAELYQKNRALAETEDLTASTAALALEGEELEALKLALEVAEVEFDLVEKNGLAIKSQMENCTLKIADIHIRQRENLEKIRELKEHEHSSICPLCSAPIVDRVAVIDRYLAHNREMDSEISNLEGQISEFDSRLVDLRRQFKAIRNSLEQRKELDRRIGRFNERERAVERARQSEQRLAAEKAALVLNLEQNNFAQVERETLIALKAELLRLDFDPAVFTALQAQLRSRRHIEGRHFDLERELAELARINDQLPRLRSELQNLHWQLSSESYGASVRDSLKETMLALEALAYDRLAHARLKDELKLLFTAMEKMRDLRRAIEEKPQLESEMASLCADIAERGRDLEALRKNHSELVEQLALRPGLDSESAHLEPTITGLRNLRQEVGMRVAVLAERVVALSAEQKIQEERSVEQAALAAQLEELQYLAEAFGKKGIQAVIIENAIPEIEAEANRILSRLTDNKMHVALVTQTRTKAGGLSETLELVMGDEIGTRSYELYSGGEAFKVNFALRIALARLLARRAGAKLETLIIDEGFGSQDDGSRDRLVKAIGLIKSDFSRVLVITHISDVKDMFPVQIQVAKKNGISTFKLVS